MSYMNTPVELTDLELDAVAGGTHGDTVQNAVGLIVAQVAIGDVDVDVDILNDANVGVQAAVAVIGRNRLRQDQRT